MWLLCWKIRNRHGIFAETVTVEMQRTETIIVFCVYRSDQSVQPGQQRWPLQDSA